MHIIKKISIVIVIVFVVFFLYNTQGNITKAYSKTGHEGFTSVDFYVDGKMLIDMTKSEKEQGYKLMGRAKFWGWKTHFFQVNKEAFYVGTIIFSKINRTSSPYTLDYTLQEEEVTQRSIKVDGSVSGKITGNIKKISTSITGDTKFGFTNESKKTSSISEETNIKVTIQPNTSMILRISGDALVTTAVSKYYIFGMNMKKGAWERIDVVTYYYELIEKTL